MSTLELPEQATVADLLAHLAERLREHPTLVRLLPRIAVSVNAEYARPGQILQEGDTVGLLPPVSGGLDASAGAPMVTNPVVADPVLTYLTRAVIPSEKLMDISSEGVTARWSSSTEWCATTHGAQHALS